MLPEFMGVESSASALIPRITWFRPLGIYGLDTNFPWGPSCSDLGSGPSATPRKSFPEQKREPDDSRTAEYQRFLKDAGIASLASVDGRLNKFSGEIHQ